VQAEGDPSGTSDAATEGEQAELGARRLGVEARALLEKAERVLETVGTQDAEDLVNAIEGVKDALTGDEASMKPSMDTLADLLYYLEA